MDISAEDIKTYATDLKVAVEKVVANRKGLQDYQNALIELYDALETVSPVLRDEDDSEAIDTFRDLFDRVSEMTGLDDQIYFGNHEEGNTKIIIETLNEIAESGGIKDSEEDI